MKKINLKVDIPIISCCFIALVLFITTIFITNRTYFTIYLVANIFMNFALTSYLLLVKDNSTNKSRFSKIAIYLLSTLILLVLSVFITRYTWDLSVYSNLMYIKNMELYLIIYGFFVLVMISMSLYVVIKELTGSNKISIRQKSAK